MSQRERKMTAAEILSLVVFGLSVFSLTGLLFYDPVEYFAKEAVRHPREVPFVFARVLYGNLGLASYVIVIFAALWSGIQFFRARVRAIGLKAFGILLLGCSIATLAGTLAASGGDGARLKTGGIVGTFLSERLQEMVGTVGLYVVVVLFLAISLIFVTDWFFLALFRRATPAMAGGAIGPSLIARVPKEDEPASRSIESPVRSTHPSSPVAEPTPYVRPRVEESRVEDARVEESEAIAEPLAERVEEAAEEESMPPATPLVRMPVEEEEPRHRYRPSRYRPLERVEEPPATRDVEPVSLEAPVTRPLEPITTDVEDEDDEATSQILATPASESSRTDAGEEIELEAENLVFESDDNEEEAEDIIILDGTPGSAEWVDGSDEDDDDDESAALGILQEVAEPDAEEGGGIEVEMGGAETSQTAKAVAPAPIESETIAEPEPPRRSRRRSPRVTEEAPPAEAQMPSDAERIETLARELALERQRAAAAAVRAERAAEAAGSARDEDLYRQAVRLVLTERRGSVSLLQRRLEVGYARATKFLERMEEEGLVGPYEGSKARDVFLSVEEWEKRA